jgi:hypothetical protein
MTDELLTTGETAEAAPAPASVAAPRAEIEYVVLFSRGDDDESGGVGGRIKAKTPDAAIEAFIGEGDPGTTRVRRDRARYWSPQSYGVEIETTRKLVPKAAK